MLTRALPQHSSISRYVLLYMQPADRRSTASRRDAVEQDGSVDLLACEVVFIANRTTRNALAHKIGDQASRNARTFDHRLSRQDAGAALDHVALCALQRGEILARRLLRR